MSVYQSIERGFYHASTNQTRVAALENGMLFTMSAEALDDTCLMLINERIIKPIHISEQKYRRFKYIPFFKKKTKAIQFEVINAEKYIGGFNG